MAIRCDACVFIAISDGRRVSAAMASGSRRGAIAAACAEGETLVTGAEELRVKESDRIAVMARGLDVVGVRNEVLPDGLRIEGGPIAGGVVDSHGDHRVAMSFAMASLRASAPIEILDVANVATSFPGFADLARSVGLPLAEGTGS